MKTTRMIVPTLAIAALAIITVAPASAQSSETPHFDGRWTPYLGCWHLVVENVRNHGIDDLIRSATQNAANPSMTVCVQPSSSSAGTSTGVTMTSFADGKKVLEQTIVADGAGHPVSESGCTGTQTSDWSRDGLRLFTKVEMACNNRPTQTVSGLTLFAKGPAWVDIQAMKTDGDPMVRIRRYVRTAIHPEGQAALAADVVAKATLDAQNASVRGRLSEEDVTEASAKVASQAVEAAIVETESRFTLNSRALVRLADAGVSPNVIDLMVAQSFPSHFRVERPASAPLSPVAGAMSSTTMGSTIMGTTAGAQYPMAYPGYQLPYPTVPIGAYDPYFYGYYYSPFAYPYYWGSGYYGSVGYYGGAGYYGSPAYYGGGNTYYIGNGGTVIANGSGSSPAPVERGQVVNGRGYTHVHAGSAPATTTMDPNQQPASSTPRTVRGTSGSAGGDPSGAASSPSSSSSSGSSSSGSSGGSGVSSTGGYSGGGGGDSGRTAQPR